MWYNFFQAQGGASIFNFPVFIASLAILSVVYTITDVRLRFRIAVAPVSIYEITYWLIGLIGAGTLLTDIWFGENWPIPKFLNNQLLWQGCFGGAFLFLMLLWIYYAFIRPPIFGKRNYKKFVNVFYAAVVKGSDNELPILVNELARSAPSIVRLSKELSYLPSALQKDNVRNHNSEVENYAYDFLLLIGSRKLCRYIVSSSSITAMAFFQAMTQNKKYQLPIGQFSKNITLEAIIDKDSILYHEDEGYRSGLIGYLKPFCQTIYGNYPLVEALTGNGGSPLAISSELSGSWDAVQLKTYCGCVLITFKNYVNSGSLPQQSIALIKAFNCIASSCQNLYKLNDINSYLPTDILKRLKAVTHFVDNMLSFLGKLQNCPETTLKMSEENQKNFYDHIADFMFEVILSASSINVSPEKHVEIEYRVIWNTFFSNGKGNAKKIINYKLRRLLYNEINQLNDFPNYRAAKILGFCLNALNLSHTANDGSSCPLRKLVINWVKINYLHLRNTNPEIANACLIGSISFDQENNRLVKTYNKGLHSKAPRRFLPLL